MKTMHTAAAIVAVTVAVLTVLATGALAAETAYDTDRTIILDGEVRSVDWSGSRLKVNFHSNDGYDTTEWVVTGPPPAQLLRMGWTRADLPPKVRVDAVVHPASDGSRDGSLIRFYLNDGRTLEISRFGSTEIIPREALSLKFTNPADDPMGGVYGNTQNFWADNPQGLPEANYNGHSWYNDDHTLMMFSNDLRADGTWSHHVTGGIWWLEKQQDKWTRCMLFTGNKRPYCHSPVGFEKVGDKWTAILRGAKSDWVEHRELEAGRH
jgi:hypothetical protein